MGCRLHDPHFTEEETEEIERFVNLPNITQQSQGLKLAAESTPLTSVQCRAQVKPELYVFSQKLGRARNSRFPSENRGQCSHLPPGAPCL